MLASVRAFLDQIIDYAGLFPPAKLPLEEALKQYLHIKKNSPYRWILGRFVCPAARLHDLMTATNSLGQPVAVAALGKAAAHIEEFLPQVEADMGQIEEYRQEWRKISPGIPPNAEIATYEVAIPPCISNDQAVSLIDGFVEKMGRNGLQGFLEIPLTECWESDVNNICRAIDERPHRTRLFGRSDGWPGLKIRCGGLKTEAFPTDAQVAHFIESCGRASRHWKATAGLHHPRRHWDEHLKLWQHGFLNVFAAGILRGSTGSYPDLIDILADRDLTRLRFEPERMVWNFWECNTQQIAEARASFATSFGSCSFEEPCADLIAMGLLDRDG